MTIKEQELKYKIKETKKLIGEWQIELYDLLSQYKVEAAKNIDWDGIRENVDLEISKDLNSGGGCN